MSMEKIHMEERQSYGILSLEAKDLYVFSGPASQGAQGYCIRDETGNIRLDRFRAALDYSLDVLALRQTYARAVRRRDFSFVEEGKTYTQSVINVTFRYSLYAFNRCGRGTYLRAGHRLRDCEMTDCACVVHGKLIAIRTGEPVEHPLSDEVLGPYFTLENGMYRQIGRIPVLADRAELRRALYRDGFVCDGRKYVRYQRSSGSSRVGKCLFIDERLAGRMARWNRCGLSPKQGEEIDLAAWEAYTALPVSSIIGTLEIRPENILVIDDWESAFEEDAVAVEEDGGLCAGVRRVAVRNSIWDGQSLMDQSLFGTYRQHGMLLLRNRFFKTCAFNTNLQGWFAEQGITQVSQLAGFTLAKRIQDVKLVTTPSSIKYLKFGTLRQWLGRLDSTFGIVKHEKPTRYFDGRMVRAHY